MRLKVWGARGSVPSPGPHMNRYGGNTSCVQLTLANGEHLILDAGTGIRTLGLDLGEAERIHILLTHLHLDHIQGLMFFPPCFKSESEITIWGPSSPEASLEDRIARYISAPLSPVEVRELPCSVSFRDTPVSEWELGGARIRAEAVTHRGPDARLSDLRRRNLGRLHSRPRAGAGRPAGRPRPGLDLGLRPGQRRRPADPRLPVRGRRIPRARRLGALWDGRRAHLRAPDRGQAADDVPPRPAALRRVPRSARSDGSRRLDRARAATRPSSSWAWRAPSSTSPRRLSRLSTPESGASRRRAAASPPPPRSWRFRPAVQRAGPESSTPG